MTLKVAHFGKDSSHEPVVVATATCNGLGSSPYQTWAFRRAEVTAFVGSPFRLPSGNMLAFGRVRTLDPRLIGPHRLLALLDACLGQLDESLARIPTRARLGVVLCVPERADPARDGDRGRYLRRLLESHVIGPFMERGFDVTARTSTSGHAAFGSGAREVGAMLESGQLDVALLIGVDSHYDPFVVQELIRDQRVLDEEWREGFVPGEAASALVIARPDVARELGLTPLATLDSAASNEEVATETNDVGLLALGLSRPAVAIAKRLKRERRALDWWISDATGEPFRIQELELAWPRAAHLAMTPEGRFDLLPTHLGDVGAATMPTAAALAIEGLRRGDPRGSTCVVTGSSREGERSVLLFTARPAA